MKGMIVKIYKFGGEGCTAEGVTGKEDHALIVGDGIPERIEDPGNMPVLRVLAEPCLESCPGCGDNAPGERWNYFVAVPVDIPNQTATPPFGGKFVYSGDPWFRSICGYPIPVHDGFAEVQGAVRDSHAECSGRNSDRPTPESYLLAYIDGGSRGNPGPAAYGLVITDESSKPVTTLSEYLDRQTNNSNTFHESATRTRTGLPPSLSTELWHVLPQQMRPQERLW